MLYTKMLLAHAALGNHVETFEGIRDGKLRLYLHKRPHDDFLMKNNFHSRFDSGRTDCNIDDTNRTEILSDRTVRSNCIEVKQPK